MPARMIYPAFPMETARKDHGMNNAWMRVGEMVGRLFILYYRGLLYLLAGMVKGAIQEVRKIAKS